MATVNIIKNGEPTKNKYEGTVWEDIYYEPYYVGQFEFDITPKEGHQVIEIWIEGYYGPDDNLQLTRTFVWNTYEDPIRATQRISPSLDYTSWKFRSPYGWTVGYTEEPYTEEPQTVSVGVQVDPANGGSISLDPGGHSGVGTYTFESGTGITIVANAFSGFKFVKWVLSSGAGSNDVFSRSHSFSVQEDVQCVAYFREATGLILRGASGRILHGASGSILRDE